MRGLQAALAAGATSAALTATISAAPASVTEHDVIIVGLGPTGATLANLLGACGVSVLVLERRHGAAPR